MNKSFITPLKDLCNNFKEDIVDGPFGANLKREHYQLEGIPVLKIQNIKPFNITLKKMDYVTEEKYLELKRHSYSDGDIIMTKLGNPLGESAIVEGVDDGLIVADLVRIRAQKVDTKYLCYHLNSPVTIAYINSQQKGTTRPRVRISVVRDLPIYTPPIPEQKRIVALLDTVFADLEQTRAKTEQNLKNARELFDSYLQQVFSQKGEGWVEYCFSKCFKLKSGNNLTAKKMVDGDYSVFGGNGIAGKHNDFNLSGRNVIIGRVGALCGNVRLIEDKIWLTDNAFKVVDFNIDFNLAFLTYLLNFKNLRGLARQAAQPVISNSSLKDLLLNFPKSIEEQRLIALKLDDLSHEISELEKIYNEKTNKIDELKKSILQKAFSGELTTTADE